MKRLKKKIEEEAKFFMAKNSFTNSPVAAYRGFIAGAMSPEAKEYWQKEIGMKLSKIIYADPENVSDGECIDQIIDYLRELKVL